MSDPSRHELVEDATWLLENLRSLRYDKKKYQNINNWDRIMLGIANDVGPQIDILRGLGIASPDQPSELQTSPHLDVNFYTEMRSVKNDLARPFDPFTTIENLVKSHFEDRGMSLDIAFLYVSIRIMGQKGAASAVQAGWHTVIHRKGETSNPRDTGVWISDIGPTIDFNRDKAKVLKRQYTFEGHSLLDSSGLEVQYVNTVYNLPSFVTWKGLQAWDPSHSDGIGWDTENLIEEDRFPSLRRVVSFPYQRPYFLAKYKLRKVSEIERSSEEIRWQRNYGNCHIKYIQGTTTS